MGAGVPALLAVEDPCTASPFETRFLHICGFTFSDSNNSGLCSTVVFAIEKYPCINGPVQFKLCCSRFQLYCCYLIARLPGPV